jgi:hypothetical protein
LFCFVQSPANTNIDNPLHPFFPEYVLEYGNFALFVKPEKAAQLKSTNTYRIIVWFNRLPTQYRSFAFFEKPKKVATCEIEIKEHL